MQRMTRQRSAVADVLNETEEFRSAQQLHDLLRERGEAVGLATVYRTLQTLSDAGAVDVLRTAEGENLYRRCEAETHHHHIVCRECGFTVEIDGPGVEAWATQVGKKFGFSEIEHVVEIFGLCSDCAAKNS